MKKIVALIAVLLMMATGVSALQYYYDIPSDSQYPDTAEYDVYSYDAGIVSEAIVPEEYVSQSYEGDLVYGQPIRSRALTSYNNDYRGLDHVPTYWTRFSQVVGPLRYNNLPVTQKFRLGLETEEYPYYEYRQNFAKYGSDYYPPFFQTDARAAERELIPESKKILEPIGGHFPLSTGRHVYATEMTCIETGRERRVFTGTPMNFKVRDVISSEGDLDVMSAVCPTASAIRKEVACIVAPNTFVRLACGTDATGKRGVRMEPMQPTELSTWTRTKLSQNFHAMEMYPSYS